MYLYKCMKKNYKLRYCEKLIENGLITEQIIPLLKTMSSRNKNYWIERGYDYIDAQKMANSRMPGTIEYYTIYKNVPLDDAKFLVEKYKTEIANTKEKFIKKYGNVIGGEKWSVYCEKQRVKNN